MKNGQAIATSNGAFDWEGLKRRTASEFEHTATGDDLRRVFHERAAALARGEAVAAAKDVTLLLTFLHGALRFAVDLGAVLRVLGPRKLTRVPNAPRSIERVLHERGRIVSVLDPSALFGTPVEPDGNEFVVLLDNEGTWLGVRATRMVGPKHYDTKALSLASASLDARAATVVKGVAEDMTIVLDAALLVQNAKKA